MHPNEKSHPFPAQPTREKDFSGLLAEECHATINAALRRRHSMIHPDDFEDLHSQVVLRLLRRLSESDGGRAIDSFKGYVTVVTYHVVDDYVRERNPERAMLANRVRYVLSTYPEFAVWSVGSEMVCGRAEWRGANPGPVEVGKPLDPRRIAVSLRGLFDETGRPMPLQTVITLFMQNQAPEEMASSWSDNVSARVESRDTLVKLWREIIALPLRQPRHCCFICPIFPCS